MTDSVPSNTDSSWLTTSWHKLTHAYTTQHAAPISSISTPQAKKKKSSLRVQRLEISIGQIVAHINDGKASAFELEIGLPILDDATWQQITNTLSSQALFGAQMLAGNLPVEIQNVFEDVGASLLPASLDAWSAPHATISAKPLSKSSKSTEESPQNPVISLLQDAEKETASLIAVFTLLGELIEEDPWLLLELHGRTQSQILQALRESRVNAGGTPPTTTTATTTATTTIEPATESHAPDVRQPSEATASVFYQLDPSDENESPRSIDEQGLDDDLDRFWGVPKRLKHIHHQIETPEIDLILLRRLGPPPFHQGSIELYEQLETLYRQVSERAIALAYTENAESSQR